MIKEFELDTFKGISKYKRIEVWWLDAQHGTTIIYQEDFKELRPALTRNIGYLIEEKKIISYLDICCLIMME